MSSLIVTAWLFYKISKCFEFTQSQKHMHTKFILKYPMGIYIHSDSIVTHSHNAYKNKKKCTKSIGQYYIFLFTVHL